MEDWMLKLCTLKINNKIYKNTVLNKIYFWKNKQTKRIMLYFPNSHDKQVSGGTCFLSRVLPREELVLRTASEINMKVCEWNGTAGGADPSTTTQLLFCYNLSLRHKSSHRT